MKLEKKLKYVQQSENDWNETAIFDSIAKEKAKYCIFRQCFINIIESDKDISYRIKTSKRS